MPWDLRHLRIRGIVLDGWTSIVRACAGVRFDGELYASADEPSMAILHSLMRNLEGDRECPLCHCCLPECTPARG